MVNMLKLDVFLLVLVSVVIIIIVKLPVCHGFERLAYLLFD